MTVPWLTSAVQSDVFEQVTPATVSALAGAAAGDHVTPPSSVVTTTPLPGTDAPFVPTAMQASRVGHEMPLSCGVEPPVRCWASQVVPPFLVATITVAPPGGAGFGPATPTAQQRVASAHETAPS